MMNENNSKIILEDQQSDFSFNKSKSNLDINFNRISFIFFVFYYFIDFVFIIHLGSRESNKETNVKIKKSLNSLYRADILDRNGNYLSKSVSSIDIGISPRKIIDEEKLILNLKIIFPKKLSWS